VTVEGPDGGFDVKGPAPDHSAVSLQEIFGLLPELEAGRGLRTFTKRPPRHGCDVFPSGVRFLEDPDQVLDVRIQGTRQLPDRPIGRLHESNLDPAQALVEVRMFVVIGRRDHRPMADILSVLGGDAGARARFLDGR
jgi:hypothetical protein